VDEYWIAFWIAWSSVGAHINWAHGGARDTAYTSFNPAIRSASLVAHTGSTGCEG